MRRFNKSLILIALFTIAFSWTAFFEKVEQLRDKKEEIKNKLDLKSLGLSNLKDLSIQDLAHFEVPDLSSTLEKLKHIIPKDLDPAHHKEIDEFWTGFFEVFKLSRPSDLIDCFGTVSGPVYIRLLRTVNEFLHHSKEGNNLKLHTDYASLEVLMHALEHTHKCMFDSQDLQHLADKTGMPHDLEEYKRSRYLYFEAKYHELADEYQRTITEIDDENFKEAGKNFAEIIAKITKDYKEQGEDLLMYQAFGNGLSASLGVSLPSEGIKCYNAKNAKLLMDFFRGISNAVTKGKWYKADRSTEEYWEKEGKKLLDEIPTKVWVCDMKSDDSKQISEKIGVELGGKEFRDKMWKYVNDHNIMYYSHLRSMKLAFDKYDYLHAGSIYGHLVEAVVKSS